MEKQVKRIGVLTSGGDAPGMNAAVGDPGYLELIALLGGPAGQGQRAPEGAVSADREVMGRHAGYLALYVGISVGATAVLIPERELPKPYPGRIHGGTPHCGQYRAGCHPY